MSSHYTVSVTATDDGGTFTKVETVEIAAQDGGETTSGRPVYRRRVISPHDLRLLAKAAMDGESETGEIVWHLFQAQALNAYTHIDECRNYAEIDARWERGHSDLVQLMTELEPGVPAILRVNRPNRCDTAGLLLFASLVDGSLASLWDNTQEMAHAGGAYAIGWYRRLADRLQASRIDESARLWMAGIATVAASAQYHEIEDLIATVLNDPDGLAARYRAARELHREATAMDGGNATRSPQLPALNTDDMPSAQVLALIRYLPMADACLGRWVDHARHEAEQRRSNTREVVRQATMGLNREILVRPKNSMGYAEKSGWVGGGLLFTGFVILPAIGMAMSGSGFENVIWVVAILTLIAGGICIATMGDNADEDARDERDYEAAVADYNARSHEQQRQRAELSRANLEQSRQNRIAADLDAMCTRLEKAANGLAAKEVVEALRKVEVGLQERE